MLKRIGVLFVAGIIGAVCRGVCDHSSTRGTSGFFPRPKHAWAAPWRRWAWRASLGGRRGAALRAFATA